MTRKEQLANVRKILVKVGSAVLTGEDGLDLNIIEQLVGDIAACASGASRSSSSVRRHRLREAPDGNRRQTQEHPQKQAAAAIARDG